MTTTDQTLENLTLTINQEIHVKAPLDVTFAALLVRVHEDSVAIYQRRGLHLPGDTPHPPQLLAGFNGVTFDLIRTRDDQFNRTPDWLVHAGRTVAPRSLGPFRPPAHPPAVFVYCDQKRICVLIANEHDFVAHENRRRSVSIDVIEWAERDPPPLIAVWTIREQSEVAEEHIHVFAIGDRSW